MKRLLNCRRIWTTAVVAALAGVALAGGFSWSDLGSGHNWTTELNWNKTGITDFVYPATTADDAVFPIEPGGGVWGTVNIDFNGTKTIDDMTILDGVEFVGHAGSPPTLKMDILTIDAGDAATTVKFTDDLTLIANEP